MFREEGANCEGERRRGGEERGGEGERRRGGEERGGEGEKEKGERLHAPVT